MEHIISQKTMTAAVPTFCEAKEQFFYLNVDMTKFESEPDGSGTQSIPCPCGREIHVIGIRKVLNVTTKKI